MALYELYLYLANDFTTTAASTVQANNTDIWPSAALVPSYAYLPLSKIWLGNVGVPSASSAMSDRIIYQLGMGLEDSRGDITLYGTSIESCLAGEYGLDANNAGASSMTMDIYFRLPEEKENWNKVINAELRVRYLLDENWRKRRSSTPPWVPNLGDYSVIGPVRCTWQRILMPPNSKELVSRYFVCFYTAVPR